MWVSAPATSRGTGDPGGPGGPAAASGASRFAIVLVGVSSAASVPSSSATVSSKRATVGSSPYTSSPTSARAVAARIRASGTVRVSLRKSSRGEPACAIAAYRPGRWATQTARGLV